MKAQESDLRKMAWLINGGTRTEVPCPTPFGLILVGGGWLAVCLGMSLTQVLVPAGCLFSPIIPPPLPLFP